MVMGFLVVEILEAVMEFAIKVVYPEMEVVPAVVVDLLEENHLVQHLEEEMVSHNPDSLHMDHHTVLVEVQYMQFGHHSHIVDNLSGHTLQNIPANHYHNPGVVFVLDHYHFEKAVCYEI